MTTTARRALPDDFCALVMAAGQGTRMRSDIAKVLHPLGGLPMVAHVLELCQSLVPKRTLVVIGHQAEQVRAALETYPIEFIHQAEQRGTAHAVLMAETALEGFAGDVLVINGDVPLLSKQLLERVLAVHRTSRAQATLVTTKLSDPHGYGRVLRDRTKAFKGIVEEVEATPAQRRVTEINAGIYCFRAQPLFAALHKVRPSTVKGELYLPEVLQMLRAARGRIATVSADDPREVLGINTRAELAEAAGVLRRRVVSRLMESGVTCLDPAATYVSVLASVGRDTVLYPGAQIEGRTQIGDGCTIHAGARIRDSQLGNRVTVLDGSVILDSEIADEAVIGPYAHLRPGNRLSRKTKVGNFVELKKSLVGPGSKIPHLTYVGDSVVGERVNIGAGTITCNYDGFAKNQTVIEDEVFIGSNSCLVAPVTIRRGAYVAAGSTITDEVPSDALAFGRARQTNKEGLAAVIRKNKAELKAKKAASEGH
ncbi:MAG TPA: bifunctional UDP-N-acetylglucosamine diphosphorylase/glucosamine-1-phosphate N-acetyltransferase GlmU [Candidatus Baltobacteraceae bacterium]|nr:bifunctional UDP-N-acetylglucosamine diphosphorylase/glucosamine-1-phosphate N-acetyltransferase GlmU [Candidatus Baltobacteraceae bacterium]